MLAFRRWDRGGPGVDVVIVTDSRHEPRHEYMIGFPAEGSSKARFQSDWSGTGERLEGGEVRDVTARPGECDGRPCRGAISIPPDAAPILSRDRN